MSEEIMTEVKECKDSSNQEIIILDDKGYDITEFLCRCPNKTKNDKTELE